MLAKLIPFFIPALFAFPALARSPCEAPSRPSCIAGINTFDDQFSYDRCHRQVRSYEDDMDAFLACLLDWFDDTGRQAEREKDEALSEYEDAVRYWNCKSQDPEGFCFGP